MSQQTRVQATPDTSVVRPAEYDVLLLGREFLAHLQIYRRYSRHTIRAYSREIDRFGEFLREEAGGVRACEVEHQDIVRYVTSLSHLAPASICRALDALSSFFAFLVAQGLVAENPVDSVPRPRRPDNIGLAAKPADCKALLVAADTPLERLVVGLGAYVGLRRAEVLGLNLSDFDPAPTSVLIRGKGERRRQLPLAAPARRLLEAYLEDRGLDEGPLLLNQVGNRLGPTSFQRVWRRLRDRAGVPEHLTFDSLRHHAATAWLRAGGDVRSVQRLLGHQSLEATLRYLHADPETMRATVEGVPDYLEDIPEAEHDGSPSAPI